MWSKAFSTDGQWRKIVNWSSTGGATWGYSSTNSGFYQAFGSAPSWFSNLSGSDQVVSSDFYQWPAGDGSGIYWEHSSVTSVTTTSGGASGIAAYHVFLWNSSGITYDYTPGSTMTVPYSESGSFGFTTVTRSGSGTHSGIGYGHQTAFGMNWNTQFGSYTTGMSSQGIYGDLVTYSKPAGAQDDWRWEYINGTSTLSTFSTANGAVIYWFASENWTTTGGASWGWRSSVTSNAFSLNIYTNSSLPTAYYGNTNFSSYGTAPLWWLEIHGTPSGTYSELINWTSSGISFNGTEVYRYLSDGTSYQLNYTGKGSSFTTSSSGLFMLFGSIVGVSGYWEGVSESWSSWSSQTVYASYSIDGWLYNHTFFDVKFSSSNLTSININDYWYAEAISDSGWMSGSTWDTYFNDGSSYNGTSGWFKNGSGYNSSVDGFWQSGSYNLVSGSSSSNIRKMAFCLAQCMLLQGLAMVTSLSILVTPRMI